MTGGIGLLARDLVRLLTAAFLAVAVSSSLPAAVEIAHAEPYPSYTYDFWGNPVPSPQAYVRAMVIDGDDMGVGPLNQPRDLFVDAGGCIYISDTGNNRIICLDAEWSLLRVISEFERDGATDRLNTPLGIFVTDSGQIFVADRGNRRVVQFNRDGDFVREISSPQTDVEGLVSRDLVFRPFKVAVDRADRVYVLAEGVYDGVMVFALDGTFRGYIGSPRVEPSLADLFWSRFATEEQRSRMALFLPTEYNTIDLDDVGFLYATEKNKIRRLNPAGIDILRRVGFHEPVGDVSVSDHAFEQPSYFEDVVARGAGIYSTLDRQRGRVFTYNSNGELLYVFGGVGSTRDLFASPTAIECAGEQILVLDRRMNHVVVFEPTRYARLIHTALQLYNTGHYDEAADVWREVLNLNVNYDQAYSGIARSYLRTERYAEAVRSFRLGNNRKGYSEAFRRYREEFVRTHFSAIAGGLTALAGLLWVALWLRSKRRRTLSEMTGRSGRRPGLDPWSPCSGRKDGDTPVTGWLRRFVNGVAYSLVVIAHPLDGFHELKRAGKALVPAATGVLALVVLTYVCMCQYTGFVFNTRDLSKANVLVQAVSVLAPFLLWCAVNWALTTLMDGKGSFRDIYVATAFALIPIAVVNLPLTLLSNVLTQEESLYYYGFLYMSLAWSLVLVLAAMMSIHEYDLAKTFATGGLTVVGMGTVVYLGILFFSVINVVAGFVSSVRAELVLRL